ncbi:MAG: TolB family protein, partial [Microcystaceae cyanobacterium]
MILKNLPFLAVIGLIGLVLNSCQDAGFISPLPDLGGNSLNSPRSEEHPHFSYDGRLLVFASDRGNQRQILLYDVVGRRFMPLVGVNQPGRFKDQPALSADGRYIVYFSE